MSPAGRQAAGWAARSTAAAHRAATATRPARTSSTSRCATSPNAATPRPPSRRSPPTPALATSAVYHYFDGKEQLYEAVFFAVAPEVWEGMAESVADAPTMVAGIETLMRGRGRTRGPHVSPFLAALPTVASLHPEFDHLLKARTKFQDRAFRALAELGLRTGELADLTVDEATDVLRAVVMGWFFERHFEGAERDASIDAMLKAFRLMARRRATPSTTRPIPPLRRTTSS